MNKLRSENIQLQNENQILRAANDELKIKNERLNIDNQYLMKTREYKESEISDLHEKLEETNSVKVKEKPNSVEFTFDGNIVHFSYN